MDRVEAILLREAIGGLVADDLARVLVADALSAWGAPFPQTARTAREFAEGPLDRVLRARGLEAEADELAGRVARLLACVRDDEPTLRIHRGPLRPLSAARPRVAVVVLANGGALASELAASPMHDSLAVLDLATEAALAGALCARRPHVVVVDAVTTTVDHDSLASALGGCHPDTRIVVWGADHPCGLRLMQVLARHGIAAIRVEQSSDELLAIVFDEF